MDFTSLNLLFSLLVLILFWRDSLQTRELATRISRAACESYGVQFLDQTVALRRVRLRWTSGGPKLQRTYIFDFSLEGTLRTTGYIVMLGKRSETVRIDIPDSAFAYPERLEDKR